MKWLISLLFIPSAFGADVNASTAAQADVQTACNTAVDGDRVIIPAGTPTWNSSINFDGKALTIKGNGVGSTVITDNTASGCMNPDVTAGEFIRITDIEFTASSSHTGSGLINPACATGAGTTLGGVRIDHCKFNIGSAITRGFTVTGLYGLSDHNFFNVTASSGSIQCISVFGTDGNDAGFTPWTRPLSLGTTNAFVIEDCQFSYPNFTAFVEDCIDGYTGARLVVRNCGFLNDSIGFHGTDSGGWRSPVSFEVYNNNWTNNMSGQLRSCTIRGGTGIFYGNRYYGSGGGFGAFTMIYYRILPCLSGSFGSWEECDGSNYKIQSGLPSNTWECSTTGTHGFCTGDNETVGTFGNACTGGTYSRYFDGSGTGGFPGRDQPGLKPGQAFEAIWANDNDGKTIGDYDAGCPRSSPLDPANYLVPGQTHTNASIAKPGYTALQYPHPLIGEASVSGVKGPRIRFAK